MSIVEAPIALSSVTQWDRSAEVVVVGLGVAGTCAALEAHRAGADVLALERASVGGGASAASQGIFYFGGGTALQRECGYEDTVDDMYTFLRASTSTTDDESLRAFCEDNPDHFDWMEQQGVPFERRSFKGKAVYLRTGEGLLTTGNEKAWPFRDMTTPFPRGHQTSCKPEEYGGYVAMQALLARVDAENVPVMYETGVVALVIDDTGRVCGVKAKHEGKEIFIEGRKGVILAAGSFNLNEDIISTQMPIYHKYGKPLGMPTNDGAGMLLGQSVGVDTTALDGVIATASIYPPADLVKGIVVNANGERFVAEDVYHGKMAYAIERQPEAKAFLILDEEIFDYPKHGSHKFIDGFETITDMETRLGVPAGSLEKTLSEYNADIAQGQDSQHHKHSDWLKELHAPYAVFEISIPSSDYHFISLGGLRTNVNGQALSAEGIAVPGLYAVGACTGHFALTGEEYASGLSLGPGSYFGRRAGAHAAAR